MTETVLQSAVEYHRRGLVVIPALGKVPVLPDWPNLRINEEQIHNSFRPEHNVGVNLGASGLADFDFDHPSAFRAYQTLKPPELDGAAVFEHAGRPHLIVKSNGVETKRFKRIDGLTILELRGNGAQTIFPPSVHEDGLSYLWIDERDPCEVPADSLRTLACMIATAAYASEFWTEGSRHDLSLALAGFLGRRLNPSEVMRLIESVATVAGDEEFADRRSAVETTVRRLARNEPVTGLPSLSDLAPDLARALASWWGTDADARTLAGATNLARPSQADLMVEIASAHELFHDTLGTGFIRLSLGDHFENHPIRSKGFANWLRREALPSSR